jgi:hypothetical protein
MYNMYVFTKKIYKYVFIRCLDSITQALISAYFGLDSRECKCLEYLFIYLMLVRSKSFVRKKLVTWIFRNMTRLFYGQALHTYIRNSETPTFYQNDLAVWNTADVKGCKPIAV